MAVVPFTSISIVKNSESRNDNDNECKDYSHSAENIENIVQKIKLKKLYIQLDDLDRTSCASTQYFVFLLLRENSSQLETLRIRRIPTLLDNLVQSWAGELPELERIEWETTYHNLERNSNFIEIIIKSASKNVKFFCLGPDCLLKTLKMFPDDKYCRMLDRFDLEIRNEFKRRDQCRKVGRIGPALSELHIFDCHRDFKPDLLTVLNQLLRSSQQCLQAVRIRHLETNVGDLFTSVEWPTLKNVKYFQLETRGSAQDWAAILQEFIDYGSIFPALETVSLDHTCGSDDEEYDAQHEWDPDPAVVTYSSASVTKLELSLDLGQVSLLQLKAVFPNVRFLQLDNLSPNNLPQLDHIFSRWPQLEQLILRGDNSAQENDYWRNYDAEFCGIFPEEVETLWGKDEEFLRALQIVPIRPCITTMLNLRAIRLLLWASEETEPQSKWCEPSRQLLTHVTKLIALEKLRELEFLKINGPRLLGSRFDQVDITIHPWQRWET